MKHCIFILGMHRSGTSALGGVLNSIGFDFGSDLMQADNGNPKGYFENNLVYELNRTILTENNSFWHEYNFKIDSINKERLAHYISEAKKIIVNEFRLSENFVIKDPRICMLFPIWEQACLELNINIKVIIPYRNPAEVASSLNKRDNLSHEKSIVLWCEHFLSAEYLSRKYNRIFLFFDDLLDDPISVTHKIGSLTGSKISQENLSSVKGFLDKKIKHNNVSLDNFTNGTPNVIRKIVKLIQERKVEDQALFDDIRTEFYLLLDLFQNKEIKHLKSEHPKLVNDSQLLLATRNSNLFDNQFYLDTYEDVKENTIPPLEHYPQIWSKRK